MNNSICIENNQYIKEMAKYVKKMETMQKDSPEEAKLEARKALIKTGVINRNGTAKRKIVSWE